MRWAQAGLLREGLRGVLEDIALAESRQDRDALINAVGTLMPLYEELSLQDESLLAAERFYTLRKEKGGGTYLLHAWRAFIDSLVKSKRQDEAWKEYQQLEAACQPEAARAQEAFEKGGPPPGQASCVQDLYYGLLSFYWRTPPSPERAKLLERLGELGPLMGEGVLARLRLMQGAEALRAGDGDGAQIAFLEARRLFEKRQDVAGLAQADELNFQMFLSEDDPQLAFEAGMSGASHYAKLRDLYELTGLYEGMVRLYINVSPQDINLAPYARAAQQTLAEALRLKLGEGDLGGAAEVFYVSGRFRLLVNPEEGKELLKRAEEMSIKATRFDITSLCYLTRAIFARAQGDGVTYQENIALAEQFARMSGDVNLMQTVLRAGQGEAPRETL
jgi:hypothetical protein